MRSMQTVRKTTHFTSAALLAALVLSLLGLAATPARADVAQVTVVSPGGAQQTLSLEALAGTEDLHDRPYALRSEAGDSSQVVTGFSLARILDAAGADPYAFSFLEVQRPAGGAVLLSRDQALASTGDGPPAVFASDIGTGFLRPSTGAEDLNAADSFSSPQGIAIVLRKGDHLKVKATASPRRTKPGQTVEFSAVVEQAGAGEQLTYSWYFDDGSSAEGAEASHTFAKPGSYDVVVGVTTPGDETGASAVVTIQVGAPLGGPNRKGGGTNDGAGAPDHGAATGPTSGSYLPSTGSSLPSSMGPAASGSGLAPADTQVGRRPTVRRSTTTPPPPPGDLVEGELVSAEAPLAQEPAEPQAAARTGSPDGGGGIPGAAWGILATLGLLGAGAAAEAGGVGGIRFWRGRSA
jgi:plastocyanin